jgi:hypothetical protein
MEDRATQACDPSAVSVLYGRMALRTLGAICLSAGNFNAINAFGRNGIRGSQMLQYLLCARGMLSYNHSERSRGGVEESGLNRFSYRLFVSPLRPLGASVEMTHYTAKFLLIVLKGGSLKRQSPWDALWRLGMD